MLGFYDILRVRVTETGHIYIPVTKYFEVHDTLGLSLAVGKEGRKEAICFRRVSHDAADLVAVEKYAGGCWVQIPKKAWGAVGRAESFYVAIDNKDFDKEGRPIEISLIPVPLPKIEKEPEIRVINVNVPRRRDIEDILDGISADSLSKRVIKAAFGNDPNFYLDEGVPKEVR